MKGIELKSPHFTQNKNGIVDYLDDKLLKCQNTIILIFRVRCDNAGENRLVGKRSTVVSGDWVLTLNILLGILRSRTHLLRLS